MVAVAMLTVTHGGPAPAVLLQAIQIPQRVLPQGPYLLHSVQTEAFISWPLSRVRWDLSSELLDLVLAGANSRAAPSSKERLSEGVRAPRGFHFLPECFMGFSKLHVQRQKQHL